MAQTQYIPQSHSHSNRYEAVVQSVLILVISCIIYALSLTSVVDNTLSDAKLTLLVSQSAVDYGSVSLNPYKNDEILGRPFQWYVNMGDITETEGATFHHYFPVGPSILAIPVVAIARSLGMDMRTADNSILQRQMAAVSLVIIFWVLLRLGQIYVGFFSSLVISTIAIFGTTLISTLATAFWSHHFAILFISLSLFIVALHSENKLPADDSAESKSLRFLTPIALGTLLFLAFFSRASVAGFIAPLLIYLLWRDWRFGLGTALTSGLLLGCFLYWSALVFGSWLPDYYSTARLFVQRQPLHVGFIGNLVSPSRGIFVFAPTLLLIPLGLLLYWKQVRQKQLVIAMIMWLILNTLLVSRAVKWWGGWSYGSRLMTDVIPGMVLLQFILWRAVQMRYTKTKHHLRIQLGIVGLFLLLGFGGIAINSYQGLFSHAVMSWYSYIAPTPAIHTRHPWGDLFRWDYAQFLATERRVCGIDADKSKTYLDAPLPLGVVPFNSWMSFREKDGLNYKTVLDPSNHTPQPFFVGWGSDQADWRWSTCPEARIVFELEALPEAAETAVLVIRIYTLVPQRISIFFNDTELATEDWTDSSLQDGELRLMLQRSDLNAFGRNELRFEFPHINPPNQSDHRLLGIGFAGLKIDPILPKQ